MVLIIMNLNFDSSKIKQPDSFWSAAGAYNYVIFKNITNHACIATLRGNAPTTPSVLFLYIAS